MSKTLKRTLAVVMAIAMIFALSATAFAYDEYRVLGGNAVPPSANSYIASTYEVVAPTPTFSSPEVTFIIEAPDEYLEETGAFYESYTVTVTDHSNPADGLYTVNDVLVSFIDQYTNEPFEFYTKSGTGAVPFTCTSRYLYGVEYDGVLFQPDSFDLWGWRFSINDLFPVFAEQSYYVGAGILETYVSDGDVIHFFVDDPETINGTLYAANYVRILPTSVTTGSVTGQLQKSNEEIVTVIVDNEQELQMCVNNYTDMTGSDLTYTYVDEYYDEYSGDVEVILYKENIDGSLTEIGKTAPNSLGQVSFTNNQITAGSNYVFKTVVEYTDGEDIIATLGSESYFDPDSVDYTRFRFSKTTGYSRFTIN